MNGGANPRVSEIRTRDPLSEVTRKERRVASRNKRAWYRDRKERFGAVKSDRTRD